MRIFYHTENLQTELQVTALDALVMNRGFLERADLVIKMECLLTTGIREVLSRENLLREMQVAVLDIFAEPDHTSTSIQIRCQNLNMNKLVALNSIFICLEKFYREMIPISNQIGEKMASDPGFYSKDCREEWREAETGQWPVCRRCGSRYDPGVDPTDPPTGGLCSVCWFEEQNPRGPKVEEEMGKTTEAERRALNYMYVAKEKPLKNLIRCSICGSPYAPTKSPDDGLCQKCSTEIEKERNPEQECK